MNSKSMLKSRLIIALLTLLSTQMYSQFFSSGIKIGLSNSSNLSTQEFPNMAMTAGLLGEFKLAKWMRIRTEANILWSGRDDHFWAANDINDVHVELPLLLSFMPVKNLHIGAGAALNYHLISFGGEIPENKFNFGLVGHVEYRFFRRLGLGIRYLHQLSNFKKMDAIGTSIANGTNTSVLPTSSIQVSLSYSFGR